MATTKQVTGDHTVLFVTKEDHAKPSKYNLPRYKDTRPVGVKLPNGDINWCCPCLGNLSYGPCGSEFRQFFLCTDKMKENDEESAQECYPQFAQMQQCFSQFPKLYARAGAETEVDNKAETN